MKKIILIELIQERINNGSINPDIWKKAHPLVVSQYVGMAYNTIFYQIFKLDPSGLELYAKLYEDVAVVKDGDKYYSELPCSLVQMPDNSSSIKRVTLTQDDSTVVFLPARTLANPVLSRLGTIGRTGAITYDARDKIYYGSMMKDEIEKVNVYAITAFSDFEDSEDVPIPAGQDYNMVDMIVNFFNSNKPSDRATNNNS